MAKKASKKSSSRVLKGSSVPRPKAAANRSADRPGLKAPSKTRRSPGHPVRGTKTTTGVLNAARTVNTGASLPTAIGEIQTRGLRFILTLKVGEAANGIEQAIKAATELNQWTVEPLFEGHQPPELARYHVATLPHVSHRDLEIHPFDLADRIVAAAPVTIERAEPDLPQDVYEPSHDPSNPMRSRARRSGSDSESPAPDDTDWHLDLVRVPGFRATPPIPEGNPDGTGIVIGHPDTGFTKHATFRKDKFDTSIDHDFVDDDDDAEDPLNYRGNKGHGTKTSSVIGGQGVLTGRTGVAPGVKIVPVRTIKSVVVLWNGDVARAIKYAVDKGCHVISMSLGGLGTSAMEAAVNYAVSKNVIVLAAAGNQVSWVVAPANYEKCIAVAACNISKRAWKGSAHGKKVAITAPGENVWVAKPAGPGEPNDQLIPGSGTSFAVATTAGVAALWLQHHGREKLLEQYAESMPLQDVFRALLTSTAQAGNNLDPSEFGPGILDAKSLIEAPLPVTPRRRSVRVAKAVRSLSVRAPSGQLATLFPDCDPEKVRSTLASMVQTRRGASDAGVDLERAALEMLQILGTDPLAHRVFSDAIKAQPTSTRRMIRKVKSRRSAVAADMIAHKASLALARALISDVGDND